MGQETLLLERPNQTSGVASSLLGGTPEMGSGFESGVAIETLADVEAHLGALGLEAAFAQLDATPTALVPQNVPQEIPQSAAQKPPTPPKRPKPETAHATPARWLQANEAFPWSAERAHTKSRRILGGVAIRGTSDYASPNREKTPNDSTLMAAAQLAAFGDKQSEQVLRINAATTNAERLFKAKHQTRVQLKMQGGKLQQNNRLMHDASRNTLQETDLVPEMVRRTKYELGNTSMYEELHAAGATELYDVAVFSTASTAMSQKTKQEYNFFTDTETCSVQLMRAEGDNVTLETALVAGKATPQSPRHDIAAIHQLARERGVEVSTTDGTDMIQHMFLIPKGELTGVETLVEWLDDAAGGTFYGLAEPRQNYRVFAQERLALAAQFDDMTTEIVEQMKRDAHGFRTPMDAIVRLDELSAQACIRRAIRDSNVDTRVFNNEVVLAIDEARFFTVRGDMVRAEAATERAYAKDTSGSCPLRLRKNRTSEDDDDPFSQRDPGENEEISGKKKKGKCPYCRAKVEIDPCAKRIECWDCHAKVVNGKVESKGDGGWRARAKRRGALALAA